MKQKIFTLVTLLACSLPTFTASYVPTTGKLQLFDTQKSRGEITKKLLSINGLKTILTAYNCSIDDLPSYQTIMTDLINKKFDNATSRNILTALEKAIMSLYEDQVYLIGGYVPYASIILPTGIRWRWINPFSYANPFSWLGENNPKATQLLYELNELATIAKQYDPILAGRMQAASLSYQHWKKTLMAGLAVSAFYAYGIRR